MSRLSNTIQNRTFLVYSLALAIVFGIAFYIRVHFPYDNVFADGWVRYQINDPWYHMRLVENLSHNFPHLMQFDPYALYPGGQAVSSAPFYDLLLGFVIWILGAGSPSEGLIETMGAYFPAILGALITIPVFFIGKEVFNKKAGLVAAALVMILPGFLMQRTLLGFTDHHAAEVLFSTTAAMFFILAMKSARRKEVSFENIRNREWLILRKPLILSALAGITLAMYLLSWTGGALFVFIIFAFTIIQYLSDHVRGRSTDYLCIVGAPAFIIAIILVYPISDNYSLGNIQVASLGVGILAFLGLSIISHFMVKKGLNRFYFPLALAIAAGIGALLFWAVDRSLFDSMMDRFTVLRPSGGKLTVAEVKGLSPSDLWRDFGFGFAVYIITSVVVFVTYIITKKSTLYKTLLPIWIAILLILFLANKGTLEQSDAWNHFTTGLYLAFVSLAALIYLFVKKGTSGKTLLLVWSIITIVATYGQMRFSYYLSVNVALLSAFLFWIVIDCFDFNQIYLQTREKLSERTAMLQKHKERTKSGKKKSKKSKAKKTEPEFALPGFLNSRFMATLILLILVFLVTFYPNLGQAVDWAEPQRGPDNDWHEALTWMQDNTPEPFGDPDVFYQSYDKPASGMQYEYPESAYGVMSWWDYGYWITYIAHRIPNASPNGQLGAVDAGLFFTAQSEAEANKLLDKLGSKYVVIDYLMVQSKFSSTGLRGKFYAMLEWTGKSQSDFWEYYAFPREQGGYDVEILFSPAYYRSMCSRLYIFQGEEWTPSETYLISWISRELTDTNTGEIISFKVVTDQKTFSTYAEAEGFLKTHPDYEILGADPFVSPVPLEKLEHYQLVHKSPNNAFSRINITMAMVEIFEYIP